MWPARWAKELGAGALVNHSGDMAEQPRTLGVPEVGYILCLTDATLYLPRFAPII